MDPRKMFIGVCEETKCVDGDRMNEATIGDILTRAKSLTSDIRDNASYIRSNLFGSFDVPPRGMPARDVSCARDAMEDVVCDLVEIFDILRYINARL